MIFFWGGGEFHWESKTLNLYQTMFSSLLHRDLLQSRLDCMLGRKRAEAG